MNFEKIEMSGFKSFADKVEIVFDNGVTGIVGPNGCGKSNIADAVRWVLGEQSAKTLRGSNMTDVIFAGTQTRKSLSYCEVSLYFDNSQRIFKSCDYNEVILTRKLFRSGESEYYVNKQPSLLREIVRLLHECGVSKNGYSIIGQGKVSEILSSKPEDRRVIFEEAVGIAQAKSKKLETERKLERVHDNLVRIFDVASVHEKSLEPLRKAAEKTRQFLELSEQLKYHEINNYLYKYDNASVIKDRIALRIQGLDEEFALRNNDLTETVKYYNDHVEERSRSDERIKELNDKILDMSLKQEQFSGQTNVYKERISYFNSEITRLQEEIDTKKEGIELSEKAIEAKKVALKEYGEEKDNLSRKLKDLEAELSRVLSEIARDENAAYVAQSAMLKAAENLADISKNLGSLENEKSYITDKQREIIDKVNNLTLIRKNLETEKARISQEIFDSEANQKKLKDAIDRLEKEISDGNNKLSEVSNKIYQLGNYITSLETNKKLYAGLKDSFEGYPTSVKRLMLTAKENASLNQRIKGVVASIIKTDKKYEVAVETALGNAVQNVVTATPEDAQYLIEYLKRSEGGRVTFLPVSAVRPHADGIDINSALSDKGAIGLATKLVSYDAYYENVIRYLLGNTLIADNIDNAVIIAKKHRFAFKIVTLDGDVINPSGSMTGGSRRQNQTNLLSSERMIEKLTEDIKQKQAELEKLNRFKESLNSACNDNVDKLDDLNDKLQAEKQNYSALSVRLTSYESLIDTNEKELSGYNAEVSAVTKRLEQIATEYVHIEEGNKQLSKEKETASSDALKHQSENEQRKQRRDELVEAITNSKTRDTYIDAEIKAANSDIERLNEALSDDLNVIDRNKSMIENDKGIVEGFYEEIKKITAEAEESSGIKEQRDNLLKEENRRSDLDTMIKQDNLKRDVLTAEIAKISEKKHQEEIEISKVDSELEYMRLRVEEEYGETYETCVRLKDENYDITNSNEEIATLKKNISRLGGINANAIQEYEQLSAEYGDLMTQKEDLEKAEADLKEALKTIRDEMLSEFNAGFEEIRKHFQQIFKELFGGGRADLLLDYTDVDDPLNAGVEIVAEPPGKKLQKISLLSGGEMALTAIAILFAILKLRPMPFCVLDEIEAPLDDANVERFAKYLKKFSNETQFIVITHKKVTMELADALFGVTMQEKGVSKIVSVKLSDINETMTD